MTGAELTTPSSSDGELAADGAVGERGEAAGAVAAERERDFRTAGLAIPGGLDVGDVFAVELGVGKDVVGAPGLTAVGQDLALVDETVVGGDSGGAGGEGGLERRAVARAEVDIAMRGAAHRLRPAVTPDLDLPADRAEGERAHLLAAVVDEQKLEAAAARELARGARAVDATR